MSAAHHDIEMRAGEYVLGLLTEAEAEAFEGEMAADRAIRAAVAEARERFLELDLTADAMPAPAALWDLISGRLEGAPSSSASVHRLHVKPRPKAAWGFWSGVGAAGMAAALVVGVGMGALWPKFSGWRQPSLIVVLLDAQAQPGAIIEAFSGDTVRVVPLEDFAVPEGRVIQVWTLPDAKTGPVSLGLLPRLHEATFAGPALPSPKAGQLYEFTLEPAGGSPTGRPTGPILAKGFAKQPI